MFCLFAGCGSKGDDKTDEKVWKISTDTVFRPFEYTDASGKLVGIDVEILAAIAEDQGFKYELNSVGWDASIAACQAGQADAMIAGASITEKRKSEGWIFSDGYYHCTQTMTVAADSTIKGFEDLKGKQVAVKTGTMGADYANSLKDKYGFTIASFEDSPTMYQAVIGGQAAACFEDTPIMVDSIKNVPLYKDVYALAEMIVNGFLNTRYVGFGPYSSVYSFNDLEGDRLQLGVRTTKHFSRKMRFMGYAAYGFKDKTPKGGGTVEFMFDNQPTNKLTVSYKHDVMQLGKGPSVYGSGNLMSSVLAKANSQKMSMVNDYSLSWQKEWSQNFNMILSLESRRIFSNPFVPMATSDGKVFNSVGYNQAHLQLRFSKDEIVTRGVFDKNYLYSKYPVVTLDLIGSTKGIGKNEYSYFRPELTVHYVLPLPPVGLSRFDMNVGTVVGQVPYPMLKLHEGNGTYTFSRYSFNCMDYYEFASDLWVTVFWEHNFKGFFLGKIPLLKRLQWREVASLRAAYGTVRKENNGIIGAEDAEAVMLFPEKMGKLNRPYVEMGVGVTNIFRILRVDAFWRMTHRYEVKEGVKVPHDNRFVVTLGLEFKF